MTQGGVLGVVLLDYVVTPGPYPVLIAVFRALLMTGGRLGVGIGFSGQVGRNDFWRDFLKFDENLQANSGSR